MARFIVAANVSLDGYVDHDRFSPDEVLFRHWIDHAREMSGSLYGRRMYELMQFWDEEDPAWSPDLRAFGVAWREKPKWVVSRTLEAVGPNAKLIGGVVDTAIRELKAAETGYIQVAGTVIAQHVAALGLVDEYRLYLHPVVLGGGTPFFREARPRLRLTGSDRFGADVIRLTYVPE
ncbi:deaminase/reductase [Oceanicola sp. 22II-s10i]|uniref:dihydrofolate reductase family protein n=1 Tax=Oceanicola sp. 22II-s10i TaxID=1317116 RepID=UPI000B521091|nr:dihydrofolate reductase family protein [Oceanicola sp. 22II-s10i]OWU81718.1 deaminase/reductase [Oceanicola sp. 22II-s10i]